MELAEARGAALERRQEKLREAAGAAAAEEDWRPARDPSLGPRCDGAVPLLSDLALDQVVSNIEDVETLAGLPYILKVRTQGAVAEVGRWWGAASHRPGISMP